ncbi:hypothetical protein TRP66_01660 [Pseudomonas sp. JDS28PS106]|uniref:hypothetical protein n=1 Tax=Pseudomonas sp. JDS28PS106 TaxID=2497235 RepID=UPI002FD6866F
MSWQLLTADGRLNREGTWLACENLGRFDHSQTQILGQFFHISEFVLGTQVIRSVYMYMAKLSCCLIDCFADESAPTVMAMDQRTFGWHYAHPQAQRPDSVRASEFFPMFREHIY